MTDSDHQRDPFAGRGEASAARLALYCAIAISLMVADHHGRYLDQVRRAAGATMWPIYQLIHWPLATAEQVGETFGDRMALTARNSELEQRWLEARGQLSRMDALEAENARLRALLDSSPQLGSRVVVAELVTIDLEPFAQRVVLNRGASDGVYVGQPVADAEGIFGQVESVTEVNAFVRLITDPSHAIPVAVNRTGFRTIAYGTGQTDQLVLRDVPRSADLRPGDLLVSSGLGGRFPTGFPVGTVAAITQEPGAAFLSVEVRPSAAIDRSRELLLVWPQPEGPAAEAAATETPMPDTDEP